MRTFTPLLLLASAAAVATAQSSTTSAASSSLASASGSGSVAMSADLAAIANCTTAQLNAAEETLTSNQRAAQCQSAITFTSGSMLQVTTEEASEMCDVASCKAALQELYNALPNCRYQLWGLQYSAMKLLEYCGITPSNSTRSDLGSGSVGWSVLDSNSASFASAGETPSSAASDSSAASASGNNAGTMTTASVALAATASVIAAFFA
ncbi:hypothetical protein PHYBOEH_002240 [Phytophthora boehmeriae]|uniref:Elicitin-like protein n=1 Tax=Phytophthora boehmeriae TaxID=109152 RepID=A0A8T1WUU4_9STRA|nr:hypothetical protein PHYBOEH_002240 [Phytophthora boehmeriae]